MCIEVGRQNPMQYLMPPLDDDNNGVLIISRTLMNMEKMLPQMI